MPRKRVTREQVAAGAQPFRNGDPLADQLDRLLDIKQLSALMNCSPRMIFRMVQDGEFPKPLHLGVLARWRARDYDAWLQRIGDAKRKRA